MRNGSKCVSKRQDNNKALEEILENPQKFTEEAQKREKKNKTYLKALNIIFGLLFIVSTVLLIVFLILDSEITPTVLQYAGGVCAVSFLGLLYGLIDRLENVNFREIKVKFTKNIPTIDLDYQSVSNEVGRVFDCVIIEYQNADSKRHKKGNIVFTDEGVNHNAQIYSYDDIAFFLSTNYKNKKVKLTLEIAIDEKQFLAVELDKYVIFYLKKYDIILENEDDLNFLLSNQKEAIRQIMAYDCITKTN